MSVLDNLQGRIYAIMSPIYANGQVIQPRLTTQAEIRLYLSQVTQVQKSLRLLKAEVNNESKQVSMQYSDKMAHVSSHPIFGAMAGKKKAAHLSAMDRQRLHHNKQAALAPYHQATAAIDQYIQMWDRVKIDVQQQTQHGMLYTCTHCTYQWTGPIGGKAPPVCPNCGH